jgi:hypothetical protein
MNSENVLKLLFLSIYLLLTLLFISCNTEEKNIQAENQKIRTLLEKYKIEYQVQEISDSKFNYTQDYQKYFTNKDIIFKSNIGNIFNKNDTTYLEVLCDSKNEDFEIISILKCTDSLFDYSSIKKSSNLIFVAHISEVHLYEGDISYTMFDMGKTAIEFLGQCKKIIMVD